ncbi:MAG TPA: hypothetical protein VGB89_10810 [Bacteroidota bacterium]
MNRKIALYLGAGLLALSAFAFSGTSDKTSDCLLRGTPACPEYPSCCP